MIKNNMKKHFSGLVFLLLATQMTNVTAHDINGEYLYSGAEAADTWGISCLNGSSRLVARVQDLNAGRSNISALIYKDGRAANTVDNTGGDAGYSPFVSVNAGDGEYMVIVTNSQDSAETPDKYNGYNINFHCEYANGGHSDTTVPSAPIQDELAQ